jgi:hypothetical protein
MLSTISGADVTFGFQRCLVTPCDPGRLYSSAMECIRAPPSYLSCVHARLHIVCHYNAVRYSTITSSPCEGFYTTPCGQEILYRFRKSLFGSRNEQHPLTRTTS